MHGGETPLLPQGVGGAFSGARPPAIRGIFRVFRVCSIPHARGKLRPVRVYVILDDRSSATHPLGDAVEMSLRREDAERFIEEVRRDEPETGQSGECLDRQFLAESGLVSDSDRRVNLYPTPVTILSPQDAGKTYHQFGPVRKREGGAVSKPPHISLNVSA